MTISLPPPAAATPALRGYPAPVPPGAGHGSAPLRDFRRPAGTRPAPRACRGRWMFRQHGFQRLDRLLALPDTVQRHRVHIAIAGVVAIQPGGFRQGRSWPRAAVAGGSATARAHGARRRFVDRGPTPGAASFRTPLRVPGYGTGRRDDRRLGEGRLQFQGGAVGGFRLFKLALVDVDQPDVEIRLRASSNGLPNVYSSQELPAPRVAAGAQLQIRG